MKKPADAGTLRDGFTTGSAASAAAVAAFRRSAAPVDLFLPAGRRLTVPVFRQEGNRASVIKDGGDDPDRTSGAEIRVELTPFSGAVEASDFVETLEDLELVIRGGEGIGRVTRPGLAVPVGKAAVNPVPRRMLAENLNRAGCSGRYLAVLSVPGGAEIARETWNPVLGVKDGISILGTSGIVRPYSNAAYAATIALQLKSIAASGGDTAALVTGNRSAEAVSRDVPELPPEAVIRIGDFIYAGIAAARKHRFRTLMVGCMPGKLFKYACGERNTHAHQCRMTLARLREFDVRLPELDLDSMDSMGELASRLDGSVYRGVLEQVYKKADGVLQEWAGETQVKLMLYDEKGRRIR